MSVWPARRWTCHSPRPFFPRPKLFDIAVISLTSGRCDKAWSKVSEGTSVLDMSLKPISQSQYLASHRDQNLRNG